MNTSFTLFRLQTQDSLRMKMNARLKEIDRIIAADLEVIQAKAKFSEAQEIHKSRESSLNDLAAQAREKKLKRELTQSNLFSGKVRNPKELQDLQAETHALDRAIAKLEEEQLHAMMEVEESDALEENARKELQAVLDRKATENSRLMSEKNKIESEIPLVDAQRQVLIDQLDADTFRIYRNLMKSKAGRAVAEIHDDSCGACGVVITPADIQAAKSSSKMIYCKNCGRILYKS